MPLLAALLVLGPAPAFDGASFPYGSPAFDAFVTDSLGRYGMGGPEKFRAWFAARLKEQGYANVDALLNSEKDPRALAQRVHAVVKRAIPKFSLDRGFEFAETIQRGERQCYLQSVLLAGLFQRRGEPAGVAMVWKNEKGRESNNGHAVPVLRTAKGDLIVDCSDPEPFMKHEGLYLRDASGRYRFVSPVYRGDTITGYEGVSGGRVAARGLGMDFLRSQFDFYRGERAPGGFLAAPKTDAGLRASAKALEDAVRDCPQNALAVYVLGRVYERMGRPADAKRQYAAGYALYRKAGWVPDGVRQAVAGR